MLTKTRSLSIQKSSTKLLPWLTHGFVSAHNLYLLINHQWKLSHCRLRNHQWNYFHGLCMDSPAHTTLVDLEIINETKELRTQKSSTKLLPQLTHGFVNVHNLYWLRNCQWKLCRCRFRNHQGRWSHFWLYLFCWVFITPWRSSTKNKEKE